MFWKSTLKDQSINQSIKLFDINHSVISSSFQLFVRVHTLDMCSKSIMVDERMTAAQVVAMLVAKNHCKPNLDWAVVEHMPELYMGKFLPSETDSEIC